jgi:hypothetical protein
LKTCLFLLLALSLAILTCLAIVRENGRKRPWEIFRNAHIEHVAERLNRRATGSDSGSETIGGPQPPRAERYPIREIRPVLTGKVERCLTCHEGIEEISPSHPVEAFGCTVCHGGDGHGVTQEVAHQGLIGGRNPSDFRVVDKTCGRPGGTCHSERKLAAQNSVDRARTTIMATMSGVIASLRYSWGAQDDDLAHYASARSTGMAAFSDEKQELLSVPLMSRVNGINPLDPLGHPIGFSGSPADDQWRKFCARCHLWSKRDKGPSAHSSGCAACHVLYNAAGTYEGLDPTIPRGSVGYPQGHRLTTALPVSQCIRCHNRSGRIGLTYTGLGEADGYGTPYRAGHPGLDALSGERDARRLVPDIHFERGMACIDCHTPSDVMGNGRIYSHMREQVEIRCTDCHGTPSSPPGMGISGAILEEAEWRAKTLGLPPLPAADQVFVTERGTPILNLRRDGDRLVLTGRLDRKDHPCPLITNDKFHRIPGHGPDRMECSSCHARWAPQCYGCHDYRRQGRAMTDSMLETQTDGSWQETRDYYRFERPSLGINSRGRVSIMVPGCQVVYTELGVDGRPLPDRDMHLFKGEGFNHGIISVPVSPHSIRPEVRLCQDCHADPKTLGIGEGLFEPGRSWKENRFRPLLEPSVNPLGFAWESMVDACGEPLSATTHRGAHPLTSDQLKRVMRVAPCLPCHGRYDDPIWIDPDRAFQEALLPSHGRKVKHFLRGRR